MKSVRRWPAFSLSLLAHIAAISALEWLDINLAMERPPVSEYKIILIAKPVTEDKIVWYNFEKAVPDVHPTERFGPAETPQAENIRSPEVLIAHTPDATSSRQLIRNPAQIEIVVADVPAPNLVAVTAEPSPPTPKPSPRAFIPPPAPARGERPGALITVEAPPAPDIPVNRPPVVDALLPRPRFPPKPFVAPAGPGAAPSAAPMPRQPSAPPALGSEAGTVPDLKAIVLGLDPAAAIPPQGSRPGEFARAPSLGPTSSGSVNPKGASVPDVLARGKSGVADRLENATIPALGNRPFREIILPRINRTMSAPLRPSARVIPPSVEAQFLRRNVYTLVIPGPGIPGYRRDWVLWFSVLEGGDESDGRITAPIPVRKRLNVDERGSDLQQVSATIQFSALIEKDGRVTNGRVVRSTTPRIVVAQAIEELQRWEFAPALLNGTPIEVEISIEIPFDTPTPQ